MVVDKVDSKSLKMRSHYERFDCDSLLIYQNQTLPCLRIGKARRCAETKLAPLLGSSGSHAVYVDDGERILEFTAVGSRVL